MKPCDCAACASVGDADAAFKLYQEMKADGVPTEKQVGQLEAVNLLLQCKTQSVRICLIIGETNDSY